MADIEPSNQGTKLPYWRKLRWNLTLYFVILAIAPVIVVQIITLSLTTQNARTNIENQLDSIATIKTNQLQRWVAEAGSSVDLILADPAHSASMVQLLN